VTPPTPSQGDLTKQFDVACDIAKTLLTLATAVLTLTITFSKDIITSSTSSDRIFLEIGWGLFFLSILGGVWLLFAASGSVAGIAAGKTHTIYDGNTAIPMGIQQVAFVLGIILMGVFGIVAY
jgi:hypothetical protein